MHEKEKNNAKGRVIQTYRLKERETLQEIWRKTTRKSLWSLAESEREKKVLKSFEKMFEQVKFEFLNKIIYDFRLIENQFRLIETDRCSQKILKEISIDQKTYWINQKSGKTSFQKKITSFLKTLLKALNIRNKMHEYEMKCFSKLMIFKQPPLKFSNTKYALHNNSK